MSSILRRNKGKIIVGVVVSAAAVGSYYYPEQAKSLAYEGLQKIGVVQKYEEARSATNVRIQSAKERLQDTKEATLGMLPTFMRPQRDLPPIPRKDEPPYDKGLLKVTPYESKRTKQEKAEEEKMKAEVKARTPIDVLAPAKLEKKAEAKELSPSNKFNKEASKVSMSQTTPQPSPVFSGVLSGIDEQPQKPSKEQEFKTALLNALSEAQEKSSALFHSVNYRNLYNGVGNDGVPADGDLSEGERKKAKEAAQSAINNLSQTIASARKDPDLSKEPLLSNADATAQKFQRQLNELEWLVAEYKRQNSATPEPQAPLDPDQKHAERQARVELASAMGQRKSDKAAEKAAVADRDEYDFEKEVQALQQKILSEQRETELRQVQQDADARLGTIISGLEQRRQHDLSEREFETHLQEARKQWEQDLQRYLQVLEEENARRLEGVIRTQRKLFDIESTQRVEEAVSSLRQKFGADLEKAYAQVEGIQSALGTRIVQDFENRRTKLYWAACQNLLESITYGDQSGDTVNARRRPLRELTFLRSFASNEFVRSLIAAFPEKAVSTGVCTETDLKTRLSKAYKMARRTAKLGDDGGMGQGGFLAFFLSYIQHLITLDFPGRTYNIDEPIDSDDPYDLLSRIRYFVSQGDFDSALRVANLLRGQPARVFADWIRDTQQHLEARFLADLILLNAQGTSIRTAT